MFKKGKFPVSYVLFLLIPVFVVVVAFFRTASAKPTYIYAKVKVSQGLWWASSNKPNIWFPASIKKGEIETNLLGQPIAEVLEVKYYPYFIENTLYEDKFDVYLTVKLVADFNKRTQKTIFKRSALSVGSPIELNFPTSSITGTIIEISPEEFKEVYNKKIVYLTKRFAYPWEFEAIKVGDTYFDGSEEVFKVLGKEASNTAIISPDSFGNLLPSFSEPTRYITVRAEIKVKERNGRLIFGEEKIIVPGALLNLITPHFNFQEFVVSKVL